METVNRSINYKQVIADIQSFDDWREQKNKTTEDTARQFTLG